MTERCKECGFKIRGTNHSEGKHHEIASQRGADKRHAHIGPTRRSGKSK